MQSQTQEALARLRQRQVSAPAPTSRLRDLKEEEEIENLRHDRGLRKFFCWIIIATLWVELVFLAMLILFQGFELRGFALNQWAFGIFVNGVLLQTFLSVRVMLVSLFPERKRRKKLVAGPGT